MGWLDAVAPECHFSPRPVPKGKSESVATVSFAPVSTVVTYQAFTLGSTPNGTTLEWKGKRMTPEAVIKMLDAVNDGREYTYTNNNVSEVVVEPDGILFHAERDSSFEVETAEQAREIAGILVTWANAKEDTNLTANEMTAGVKLFGWLSKDGS